MSILLRKQECMATQTATSLRPFFPFYGGKWRAAPRYPQPSYGTIIEPFAGSAGYATRHPDRNVVLCDRDEVLAGLWQYLIRVTEGEIRAIPVDIRHVDEINGPQEPKWLVGFWLNSGSAQPKKSRSAWSVEWAIQGSTWSLTTRERVASQLHAIRHWKVIHGSYENAPDYEATWFIDPPYADKGKYYRYSKIDYPLLAGWCQNRRGQVIVCENEGADWLPFEPTIGAIKSVKGKSMEAMWYRDVTATPTF
jgi:hypothetical protein